MSSAHNRCFKWFDCTVTPPIADMPLDTAIYHADLGYIVGVRGGYIFKFNSSTGLLLSAGRFANAAFQYGCVCYGHFTGKLYATGWHDPMFNGAANRRIYTITPATLAVDSSYDITPIMVGSYAGIGDGPKTIYCRDIGGVDQLLVYNESNTGAARRLMRIVTPLVGSPVHWSSANISTGGWVEIDYAPSDMFYIVDRGSRYVTRLTATMTWDMDTDSIPVGYSNQMSSVVNPGGTYLYATTNTQYMFPLPNDGSPVGAVIDLGSGATATPNPYRVRWNGVAIGAGAKLYVPGYKSDAIHVVDLDAHTPAQTSDVTVKTGFDCPVDVVFTGTKIWAIQHGVNPLKEIV